MERSTSSSNAHFRIKLLQAVAQLQVSFFFVGYFSSVRLVGTRCLSRRFAFNGEE